MEIKRPHQRWIWAVVLVASTFGSLAGVPLGRADEMFEDQMQVKYLQAVQRHNFESARMARTQGADVNRPGKGGITPLLWTMGTTLDPRSIEFLLKDGANPNYATADGFTAVHLAAGGDRSAVLELLLANGGDPNLRGASGRTPMMAALLQFRDKNVEALLRNGADVNLTDDSGSTAAVSAVALGRFDWAKRFLEVGLTTGLERLSRASAMRQVPKNSPQDKAKREVIQLLRERGIAVDDPAAK